MSDASKGTYLLTFMLEPICRRYWQMCWSKRDEKPFSDFHLECQLMMEVKRMTVHIYNPYANIQDLTTFLRRHCTVTREPSSNLDSDGIWDGKWTVMAKLKEDPAALDGIHHPPSSFSLGHDLGYLYYPGQPKLCNNCSKPGHTAKDCTVQVCKNCKREGHTARACKEEAPCNLCGAVGHRFKDCPQRAKSYAQAAKPPGRAAQEEAATANLPVPAPRKTKETGRRKGPRQEQVKPDQGSTQALEPQSTEEEMPAIPDSGPIDNSPQPASEIQEEGPWMKQERRKKRHSPPQVTKKTRKKHLSNHNPNSDPEESEEEEQPGNEGPDDQLDQVTRVLQEMRALASVMEASPPPSPATAEKEEASKEEEQQSLPANLEEEEPETSQVGKPASEKDQAMVAKTTAPLPETHQEPDQLCK
ncbi:hypothetical protein NDU88_002405 [Pleurodeles waltl]|uniref:CCHC-type domain-containing protein n=1 Tax=Pleurodeles waltl TaxID=8319 RepID=A0AAV7UVH8_PLEWA|nr:hypothetical protein NDU88_002405 [Pleurodeles waltl]